MGELTDLMKQAFEHVSELPKAVQDRLADYLLSVDCDDVYQLNAEERAAIAEGLADIRAGRFLSEEDTAALFRKHGL